MEIYLGNEDSISQSEFQFLLEQQKNQEENDKAEESNESKESKDDIKNNEKIEEKNIEESSSESVDAPVNPIKIMRAKYIDIAAIFLLILTVCYLYWYACKNPQI